MTNSLFERLVQIDTEMQLPGRPSVPVNERRAIELTKMIDPSAGRGFDWLVPEAVNSAKFIHHEKSADFTVFVFADRSVLVLLSTGHVYSMASSNLEGLQRLADWLGGHRISVNRGVPGAAANQAFDPPVS